MNFSNIFENFVPFLYISLLFYEFDSYSLFLLWFFLSIWLHKFDFYHDITLYPILFRIFGIGNCNFDVFILNSLNNHFVFEEFSVIWLQIIPNNTWHDINIKVSLVIEFTQLENWGLFYKFIQKLASCRNIFSRRCSCCIRFLLA